MKERLPAWIAMVGMVTSQGALAADTGSNQPYIDEVKKQMRDEGAPDHDTAAPDAYLQREKKKLQRQDTESGGNQSYIDELKREHPEEFQKQPSEQGYTSQEKAKLGPGDQGSAIQDLKNGKSELHPIFRGNVRNAFGFKVSAYSDNNISGDPDVSNIDFTELYGTGFSPNFQFYLEHYFDDLDVSTGTFGLFITLGGYYNSAKGSFAVPLTNGNTGVPFPPTSNTKFQFIEIPVSLGAIYRLNATKVFKPFGSVGLIGIPFFEARNDDQSGHHGFSKGFVEDVGVSISLDWVSKGARWDFYQSYGIQHYYLTVDYSHLNTFASPVDFATSNINLGFTFEY